MPTGVPFPLSLLSSWSSFQPNAEEGNCPHPGTLAYGSVWQPAGGPMPGHDIVVIGTSAGGVEALTRLVAGLPANLPASLFVVVHFPAHATSALPRILERAGPLPAAHAEPNEPIRPGRIYVARPNYHLLVMRSY